MTLLEEMKHRVSDLNLFGKRTKDVDVLKSIHSLISAGVSVQNAMENIADRIPDAVYAEKLRMAADLVSKGGRTLAEAMAEVGMMEKYTEIIAIGQKTGNLQQSMREIIDIETELGEIKRKVRASATYPVVVAAVSILIGYGMTFMLGKILGALKFPGIDKVFAYQLGLFIVKWKTLLFAGWVTFITLSVVWLTKHLDRIPVVSKIYNDLSLGQAFRIMSLAVMSGLSPSNAFGMAATVVKGKWQEILEMMSTETQQRSVSEVFDEIEEYMTAENYLLVKVKLDSGAMSSGFEIAGTNLLKSGIDGLSRIGTLVSVFATILVAAQIVVIMSPIYMVIIAFMDKAMGKI